MTRRTLTQLCGFICLAAVLAGCGGGGPKLYPVTGTVIHQSKPVEGAVVTFRCDEAKTIATGMTDAQGRFELSTAQAGKGAVAGKHKVSVTKFPAPAAGASGSSSMEDAFKKPQPEAAAPKNLLPAKYADPAGSPLEFTVSASEKNDFKIELTD